MHPRVPTPDAYDPSRESLEAYGARIFAHVLAGHGTATLDVHALETADHFYPVLIHAWRDSSPVFLQKAIDAHRYVCWTLRLRRAELPPAPEPAALPPMSPEPRSGSSAVPLVPKPFTRPPSGVAVDLGF